jgi:hypothetical protein
MTRRAFGTGKVLSFWRGAVGLMGQSGEVADATGHIWSIHDLRETTVAVMLFTMVFTSILATLRLGRDDW